MPDLSADAIVVLGARIQPDGLPAAAARRRVERAAELFKLDAAPFVVPTGGKRWHGHVEALSMRNSLRRLGIPDEAIVLEPFALSTAENAYFSTRIARLRRWERLVVVTCPWHMRRAEADFAACGLDIVAGPTCMPSLTLPTRTYLHAKERTCIELDALRLRARFPW